jgi:hypothetical protein
MECQMPQGLVNYRTDYLDGSAQKNRHDTGEAGSGTLEWWIYEGNYRGGFRIHFV